MGKAHPSEPLPCVRAEAGSYGQVHRVWTGSPAQSHFLAAGAPRRQGGDSKATVAKTELGHKQYPVIFTHPDSETNTLRTGQAGHATDTGNSLSASEKGRVDAIPSRLGGDQAAGRAGAGHGEALTHPAEIQEGGRRPSPLLCQGAALMCRAERGRKYPRVGSAGG